MQFFFLVDRVRREIRALRSDILRVISIKQGEPGTDLTIILFKQSLFHQFVLYIVLFAVLYLNPALLILLILIDHCIKNFRRRVFKFRDARQK
jgi:hypothetical protein